MSNSMKGAPEQLDEIDGYFRGPERQDLLAALFEHVPEAIIVTEPEGRIVEVNQAACALVGWEKTDLLAMSPWDFVTSASRDEILETMRQAVAGEPVLARRTYLTKDKARRLMELRLSRISCDSREFVIATCRDLTEQGLLEAELSERKQAEFSSARTNAELEQRIAERTAELARINQALEADIENRKQIEERLQRSERNFAEVQRLTKTGSWILDFETGETDWSVETCRIFGFPDPPPSPHYNEFRARVRPEDRDGVDAGLRESFETGEPRPLKYLFILPDGVEKHIETISLPVKDDSGNVLRLMGTVMDVTERVKAEAALRHSKNYLRLVTDTIPELVWSARPDGSIEYLNKRWLEFTGIEPEDACGWDWQAAYHPEDLADLLDHWKSIIASGEAGEAEARLRRFDGTYRWFLVRAVPLHDAAGKLVKWYGTNTDIDERKRAEALLAGEKRILEMIARGGELEAILDAMCRLIEDMAPETLSSILLLNPDGKTVRHGAAPSLPAGYTKAIEGRPIGPRAASCGTAAYLGEMVIVRDIASDPLWDKYRDSALDHGLRACWSTPVMSSKNKVLGTFALYAREPSDPSARQLEMIEQFSHMASIAIEHIQSRETLLRSETSLAQAQALSKIGSFNWNTGTGRIFWSAETYRIFGCDPAVTPDIELVLARVHPDDATRVREIVGQVTLESADLDFEHRLLLPDGEVKHLQVVARATTPGSPSGEYVGAVMDVTADKLAAEALEASEKFARGQAEALTRALDAMASESSADRIVEHVLRTITRQLEAESCSVWLRDQDSGLMDFSFALEAGHFMANSDSELAALRPSLPVNDVWPWPEIFRTGKPYVLEDIREGNDFPWRAHVLSQGVVTIAIIPMLISGEVAGVIGIRFKAKRAFRQEEVDLAQALANQAMLAVQLYRLSKQSLDAAVLEERNRLARDIHDTLAQGFTGVILQLEAAEEALSQKLGKNAVDYIGRAGDLARNSLREARRSVSALRPQALDEKKLCEALPDLLRKMTHGTGMEIIFTIEGEHREIPPAWEDNLLRICQEVLTNALRHASATEFVVRFAFAAAEIRLSLRDNGRGFESAGPHDGFGLQGMRERMESMGGEFSIESTLQSGTTVTIVLPLERTGKSPHS